MIVTKDNERLYPATWEYNAARIFTALARIAENHGARVKYGRNAIISNRSVMRLHAENIERLEKLEAREAADPGGNKFRSEAIAHCKKEIARVAAIKNEPIAVTHTNYIMFVLDDIYYYYGVDSNPFFPFHYIKTPISGGKYSRDAACEECKKEWLYDCFFDMECSDADIIEGANLIFNMLCSAKYSQIIRDSKRQRVPNTYDGGYHYETIYAPERFEKIDF